MRRLLLLAMLIPAACSSSSPPNGQDSAGMGCPAVAPYMGGSTTCQGDLTCTYGAWVCACGNDRFSCSSCANVDCSPGKDSCDKSNWESDCSCVCGIDHQLYCSGSACGPWPPPDAGVDAP
jgi:hypothetical protein